MADISITKYTSLIRLSGQASVPSFPPSFEDVTSPINPPGSNPATNAGIGIRLNGFVIGGVKSYIESNDSLEIPEYWQYNIKGVSLNIDGNVINNGEINIS